MRPLSAAYVMVNDRGFNSIDKVAGNKVAVMDGEKSQGKMDSSIGYPTGIGWAYVGGIRRSAMS